MPSTRQWTKPWASGSVTVRVRPVAFFGTPDHASGGDTPSPSHVNCTGRGPSGLNAVLVRVMVGPLFDAAASLVDFLLLPQPASSKVIATTAATAFAAVTVAVAVPGRAPRAPGPPAWRA